MRAYKDPTADTAIANVVREERIKEKRRRTRLDRKPRIIDKADFMKSETKGRADRFSLFSWNREEGENDGKGI